MRSMNVECRGATIDYWHASRAGASTAQSPSQPLPHTLPRSTIQQQVDPFILSASPYPSHHITSCHVMSGTVVQGDLAKLLITNPIRDCQFINHCISRVVILSLSALHFQHKTNYVFPAKNCNDYLLKSAQSGAALQQTAMVSSVATLPLDIKSLNFKTKRMELG